MRILDSQEFIHKMVFLIEDPCTESGQKVAEKVRKSLSNEIYADTLETFEVTNHGNKALAIAIGFFRTHYKGFAIFYEKGKSTPVVSKAVVDSNGALRAVNDYGKMFEVIEDASLIASNVL